ncbi:MAG: S8 family serine peptidase [Phycisphaeraceae bacterium]
MLTHWDRTHDRMVSRAGAVAAALAVCAGAAVAAPQALAAGDLGGVQNGGSNGISPERVMRVSLGKNRTERFRVSQPGAFSSSAKLMGNHAGGIDGAEPVFTLFGEVLLIAEDREQAKHAVAKLQRDFPWVTPEMLVESAVLPGVYSLSARSVENAAQFVEILSGAAGVNDVMLNFEEPKAGRGGGADPALADQWHFNNTLVGGFDHGIQDVHDSGITGAGVTVGVLEAFRGNITSPYDPADLEVPGYDFSDVIHPDLFPNFSLSLSQITDPFQEDVQHETSVTGIIGAAANGTFSRGVAFNSQIAALRNGSTLENAEAWAHEIGEIDLINNSWGPMNDFYTQGPTDLLALGEDDFEVPIPGARRVPVAPVQEIALDRGLTLGRNGNGRMFVMSAGNASHFQDFVRFRLGNAISLPQFGLLDINGNTDLAITDFDLDGNDVLGQRYSGMFGDRTEYWQVHSHPAALPIAAVDEFNSRAGYSTTGTGVLAGAYSRGRTLSDDFGPMGYGGVEVGRGIVTTNQIAAGPDGDCPVGLAALSGISCTFNGTSAAAPIATGIFALMLEANPNLSIRDIEHIIQQTSVQPEFSSIGSYWTNLFNFGTPDPDDPNTDFPQFWQVNSADVAHSDEFGFGVIDADAAVAAARTWPGVGRLVVLDTGVIESEVMIPDAEFEEVGNIGSEEEPKILFNLVPGEVVSAERDFGAGTIGILSCVRENLQVETVTVTVTMSGVGAGDIFLVLESPRGSVSPIAIPRADSSGINDDLAYSSYTFKTYKHWGEMSGGNWRLRMQDFRPDAASPEGELPDDGGTPMDMSDDEPGEEHVTYLGPLGMPGAEFFEHTEKTLVSFRLEIHGTDVGAPVTLQCPPQLTSCPGDLNGNGIVNFEDLAIFLGWYNTGDPLADINGDGLVTFGDIQGFLAFWTPGFCDAGLLGRPEPNTNAGRPIIRPI